jgi:hypothetical protein
LPKKIGTRAWQNYKRQMEAKGESFDPARLIPPKVPDDQNFAMTPYFAPVFNLPPEVLSQPPKLVTNLVNGREVVEPMQIVRGTNIASHLPDPDLPPHRAGWHFGSPADLIGWAVAFQDTNSLAPRPQITDPVQAASIVLENMKPYEPTLAELQSASERPHCRFNIPYEEWDNPQVMSALLEHLSMMKGLYRLLSLHAEAEMVSGRTDQALKDINVMFRINNGLGDEPLLISELVRFAGTSIMLQSVGEGLAEHRWSDAELQVLQEHLQKTDLVASIVRALYGERDICTNPNFDRGNWARYGWHSMPQGWSGLEKLNIKMPRGWARLEQLSMNRAFHDIMLPRIDLEAREISPTVNHSMDLAFTNFSNGNWLRIALIQHSVLVKMLMPNLSPVFPKAAFAQSEVDMAMLACALERYRLAEGQYPKDLNALVPRFASVLPHDIINGQPLKYRLTDNGRFILYSVGWNEKDDGGVVATKKDNRQDILQGDWVWQYPDGN